MKPVKPLIRLLGLLTLCGLTFLQGLGQERAPKLAPSFSLTTIDQKPLRLSNYKGKVILLDFWATWCVPCQTEIPRFASFQRQYSKQGFQVIGLSMDDSPPPVIKFSRRLRVNYPIAMADLKTAKDYGGVLGLPLNFLIGRNGTILREYKGAADLDAMEKDIQQALSSNRAK